MQSRQDILIVGNRGGSNVGESFARASRELGLACEQMELNEAMAGPALLRAFSWHVLGHRPPRMRQFAEKVASRCALLRPRLLFCMGFAPIPFRSLADIGKAGVTRAVYLTDDPWNPRHRADWFMRTLPQYDYVFTARRANVEQLQRAGARQAAYLPFAYDPALCPEADLSLPDEQRQADVVFAGGADSDRVPYLAALAAAGLKVALYGSYWERYPETRPLTRGQLPIERVPAAIESARLALCLVRRPNRDDHSMRSFEVPAMGACMLTEFTEEHRALFGAEGESVVYFRTVEEMVSKARQLLNSPAERLRLAAAARARIRKGAHTYRNRLETVLSAVGIGSPVCV